jgi:hypothetical protein
MGFSIVIIFVLIVNGILRSIKVTVRENGYETHFFWGEFDDIKNLRDLIKNEKDVVKRDKFKKLLDTFYIFVFLTLLSFFIVIVSQ